METTTETITTYQDPAAVAAGTSSETGTTTQVETEGLTQEEVDAFYALFDRLEEIKGDTSGEIMDIVVEEASDYLYGDRSVEDISDYIQDRIGIMLAERS